MRGGPAREEFPTVTNEAFRLPEAKVALWGGFVFINPDLNAEPLEAYIGDLPTQFDRAPLEEKVTIAHISKVIPANWKVVNEAFLEAFHVHTTHPRSEEHTSELQSLLRISYAVFCLKKKTHDTTVVTTNTTAITIHTKK